MMQEEKKEKKRENLRKKERYERTKERILTDSYGKIWEKKNERGYKEYKERT